MRESGYGMQGVRGVSGHGARIHCVLHRAAWLVTGEGPPVPNGAVLVGGGELLAVGGYNEVKGRIPMHTEQVDYGSAALMPALVNAHTHLELTVLEGRIPFPQEGFAPWLRELFAQRTVLAPEEQYAGPVEGEQRLASLGVGLYGDITNGSFGSLDRGNSFSVGQVFLEVIGFDRSGLEAALEPPVAAAFRSAAHRDPPASLAAHACYSTSAHVIREAKEWCRKKGLPFSIHVAEHPEEIEFLQEGTGFCRELLETLGKWSSQWIVPRMTPVEYLDRLGVLDAQSLLVHVVHLTESDWRILAAKGCSVCFCPRSNSNLSVGRPAIEKALQYGVRAALGTDSLASNTDLSVFAEAEFVLDRYPNVPPEAVMDMMTRGGAQALGKAREYGTLGSGKRSPFLAVSLPDALPANQLLETIIHQGKKGECQWVSHPQAG